MLSDLPVDNGTIIHTRSEMQTGPHSQADLSASTCQLFIPEDAIYTIIPGYERQRPLSMLSVRHRSACKTADRPVSLVSPNHKLALSLPIILARICIHYNCFFPFSSFSPFPIFYDTKAYCMFSPGSSH